jgi:outer membrane protein OmpA-like peptidoglycan-associated protein
MKTKIFITGIAVLFLYLTVNATNEPVRPKPAVVAIPKKLEYDNNKESIRRAYYANLDQLVKTIKDNNYAVSLRGHADSIGKYKYNWVLSDKRAINVKDYLVSKGIKEDRIVTTPFGSTVPIATNKTAAGRQKNRRVEIELRKID